MTITDTLTVPTQALLDKMNALSDALSGEIYERSAEIHGFLLALASGSHMFMIGEPGTGKTFLVDRGTARITGANGFHILMGNFTQPSDIEGPEDIAALKQGRRRRVADGYLPKANWAFFDELWKANDSILNSLLAAFNERMWRNEGRWEPIPLSVAFAASNELPANDTLTAIYDRIAQRYQVSRIKEEANFIKMMSQVLDPSPAPILTWDEVQQIQHEVRALPINDQVHTVVAEIRRELYDDHNIDPSDRRFFQGLQILRAEAWLDGCDQVEIDHVGALINVLWDRPEQIPDVEKTVLEKANPLQRKTLDLLKDIDMIGETVKKAVDCKDQEERQAFGMEAQKKAREAGKDLKSLMDKAANNRKARGLVQQAKDRLHGYVKELITEVFQLDEQSADAAASKTANGER